ncbi:hypothetical protein PCANC_01718 [Puccinia coronata f. sp. avenae]|uniref:Integrase catalytic domain-containing protein n=1 Tax=Puccinia coronata f. sp. avenae TaxID=200324 RepID=A0A2N5W3C5_9BASI|nr:hypothetical protein PCANC_01718 [Puccinia coronata f. sp. avenae]
MIASLQAAARAQALANTNPKLSFDGSNYTEWENAIDRTLQHVFVRDQTFLNDKQDNFHKLDSLQNKAVAVLMRGTLDNALLLIVESNEITASKDLFELLRSKCKMLGRHHKIILVEKILRFAAEKSPASESWLARFCAIISDVEQAKVTVNKLGGLLLQALAKAPPGTNSKNFEYSISQPLDDMVTAPTFGQVTTVIQSALSKTSKGSALSPGSIPSDVKMSVNAIQGRQQPQRYEPPHKRNGPEPHPQTNGKFSVEKAAYFQGKGHTESLNARYGYNCRYCGEVDHWYSDCNTYWEDVCFGRVEAPPPIHNKKGSRFVPPARNAQYQQPANNSHPAPQSNGRIRKIDLPDANDGTVLLDSGSTINMSGKSRFFKIKSRLSNPLTISLAISEYVAPVEFVGSLTIPTPTGVMEIEDMFYCDGIKGSILSTGQLVEAGWLFAHKHTDAKLISSGGISFDLVYSNYCCNVATSLPPAILSKVSQKPSSELFLWHCRLGHAAEPVVQRFVRRYLPDLKLDTKPFFCVQCAKLKATAMKGNGATSDIPRDNPLDLCMTDVAGPFNMDINGCQYLITFCDHASTYTYCAIMATQQEVPDKIMAWVLHLKTALGRAPAYLRCDNAAEYVGNLKERLAEVGTTLAPISPYHPQQNGEAERENRTFGNMARTMLHDSKLPKIYWSYAYLTAAYIHNCIPKSRVNTLPLKVLYGIKPSPNKLYPFGSRAICHVPKDIQSDKIKERVVECLMLGYPKAGSGWLFYVPSQKQIVHTSDTKFPEFQALEVKEARPGPVIEAEVTEPLPISKLSEAIPESKLEKVVRQIKLVLGGKPTHDIAAAELKAIKSLPVAQEHRLPKTIKMTLSGPDSTNWKAAALYELDKFKLLGVWEPINPYKGSKALRLNQVMGTDCNETYAPTASLNTLRLLLSISQSQNLPTATVDISSAYLYSPIEEEVYVQPPVEIMPQWKGKIMQLKKAIHGTKQAARCWWKFFSGKMHDIGFTASKLEPSLYFCRRGKDFVVIWLHVDDGFAMGLSQGVLDDLHQAIAAQMEVKWTNSVEKIVGINIVRQGENIMLDQHLLVKQIIQDYPCPCFHKRSTLPEEHLEINAGESVDATEYWSTLGSLMYLCSGTRPDLSYSVNLLAQYSANPSGDHWKALDVLIGYLKRNRDLKMEFGKGNGVMQLWLDANWGGEHKRSTSGYMVRHNGNSIAWGSKRQTVVALSTCAAEYIALSDGSQIVAQLQNLLIDIEQTIPIEIYCNNEAAILIAGDNASKKKTRYLSRAFYFINDFICQYAIKIQWTDTHSQVADIFTKRLGPNIIENALEKINLMGCVMQSTPIFLAEQLSCTHPNIMLFVAAGSTIAAMFIIEKIFQSRRLNLAGILEEEVATLSAAMDTQRAAMEARLNTQRAAMEALAQQHTQLKAQLDTLQAAIKQQTPETRDHIANLGSNSF